jgi:hypothetical protein
MRRMRASHAFVAHVTRGVTCALPKQAARASEMCPPKDVLTHTSIIPCLTPVTTSTTDLPNHVVDCYMERMPGFDSTPEFFR